MSKSVHPGALSSLLAAALLASACGEAGAPGQLRQAVTTEGAGKLDTLLVAVVDRGVTPANARKAFPRDLLRLKTAKVDGQDEVLVDVLLQADPSALAKLRQLGAAVRTVTSDGIMTATVPVKALAPIAALAEVRRIEASRPVKLANDRSNDLFDATVAGAQVQAGMHNLRSTAGAGVVVGVLDTGIDWTHKDFVVDATEGTALPESRVLAYWDQSDLSDDKAPAGFTIGHEYSKADLDAALRFGGDSDPTSATWAPVSDAAYPIKATARDVEGHGTHVAGTSAGDGSGSGMQGAAPAADLVIVKFDFEGDRNSDTNIVDGVSYIFRKAAELGRPAVINMSLGSDYGPHDGSTLEERGIDALTGPGKIVAVAAGNPGANNWSPRLRWGYSLHGEAKAGEAMVMHVPAFAQGADNYVFFDLWYSGSDKCQVKVTTPSGATYPPATDARTWLTGSRYTGFNTTSGAVLVGNGGDQLGWSDDNADNEAYVEISDYYGTLPAAGDWTIKLVKPTGSKSACTGAFHAWYGVSDNVVKGWQAESPRVVTPTFNGRPSDNKVTIGAPATASKVIAVAAYMTRDRWPFAFGVQVDELGNPACNAVGPVEQFYSTAPLGTYDPFEVGELAYFSGRGPRRAGAAMVKPEIATPGVGIVSSMSHFVLNATFPNRCASYWTGGPAGFGTNRVYPGLEAQVMQGTSMATPNATGAIAALLEKKKDLDDACLRKLFAAHARRDAVTGTYAYAPDSAQTDTDSAPTALSNSDWGYGRLDVAATLAGLDSYPTCGAGSCRASSDCAAGQTCTVSTDPCGCGTCVTPPPTPVCKAAGQACTANADCCSSSCAGKVGKKVCK